MDTPIVEISGKHETLEILALTHSGAWTPLCVIALESEAVDHNYRTPLLLKFGYAQSVQSACPQVPGDV